MRLNVQVESMFLEQEEGLLREEQRECEVEGACVQEGRETSGVRGQDYVTWSVRGRMCEVRGLEGVPKKNCKE